MAQIVKLRRSSVSGQKPTNSNLQLGELALNTTDGKVFMAVSGSLGPTVEELILTNTVNTGSVFISGSLTVIGPQSITGSQQISGSISLYPTIDPDPNGLTTTATHLYVSASNNQTGEDLYIRQQDNKVKWKWFEGKLNSGILWGGALSYSGTTIYITKGSGIVIDQRASATNEISPITHYVNWNDITASCQNVTSSLATYVGIDMSGSLYQQDNYFSVNQYRETIPLGMFNHTNRSSITSYANDVLTAYDDVNQTANFIQAFGPMKLEGLTLSPQSGNLQLTIGSGQSYIYGGFYQQDPNNSSHKITAPVITPQIARVRRNGSGSFTVDNNNGAFYSTIDASHWDDGTGTLNTLGGGSYAIQRVFFNPFTNRVHVYYGQTYYGTKTAAFQSLASDPFSEAPYSAHQYVLVGYIIHKGGASDLSNDNQAQIIQAGLFRNTVGSGGGVGTFASLHDLDDVDILNPNNGDLLVYNGTRNLWEHGKNLSGNYTITGSLTTTEGFSGSLDFSYLINKPTLVSGSSQIDLTGTDGYTTFSSSISTSIDSLSSSIATTTNDLDGRLDSIEGVTGSYATTGSNTFIGNEIVSGNIVLANNGQIQIHSSDTNTLFGHFDGSTIYGPYYQMFGNQYSDLTQRGSSEFVFDTRNGGGSGFNVASFNGSGWVRKFRVDDDGAKITGSLVVTNNVTSSYFTGSYIGDGAGLYNIPASGVTGLELNKIISGNASASIDNNGFYVNRDVYVDGTITAKEIHTDYVTSSVLFQSGSTKFGNTIDDTHQFTGSVYISGSIVATSSNLVSGSSQIEITGTTGYSTFSGSIKSSIDVVTGSIDSLNLFTSSYNTGSFTGSFNGDATGLTNVPFHITGSDIYGNNVDKTFTKLQFDDSTGLNVEETDPGTAFISIGSHFKDIFVSGSPLLSATGSDAFEIIPSGGIDITTSITDTNGNGYVKELKIDTSNLSSSLNDRMDIITGSITSLSSSIKTTIDVITGSVDSLNTFSSSVVLTSQTSSMTVLSASFAATAAFALNAGGGGAGTTFVYNQTSPSTTWTVTHNLGERYPAIVVFDLDGNVIIPTNISAQSTSTLVVTFSSAQTGKVSATVGGGLPHISASYEGRVLAVYNDEPVWKAGIISGSQQLSNLGFATTGSNTFYGNQTISGTTTINIATLGSKCVTISSNTEIFDLGDFDGANFDYVVKNGTNMRAGMIMSAWDGSNSVYNETSTMDLGSTSGVTFTVSGLGVLNANITSGTWAVEVLYRALGCSTINPPSSPSSTNYSISTGYTAPDYCGGLGGSDQTVYGNDSAWTSVTRFYTDSGMTTPFNGGSLWFGDSTSYFGTTLQIDSSGYVIDSYAC